MGTVGTLYKIAPLKSCHSIIGIKIVIIYPTPLMYVPQAQLSTLSTIRTAIP
jgi:hypothetical protein